MCLIKASYRIPSEFLRGIRELSNATLEDSSFVKVYFLFRLPTHIQTILANMVDTSSIKQITSSADRIRELSQRLATQIRLLLHCLFKYSLVLIISWAHCCLKYQHTKFYHHVWTPLEKFILKETCFCHSDVDFVGPWLVVVQTYPDLNQSLLSMF